MRKPLDKIFYINLDRRPDRDAHFMSQCNEHNVPLEVVERFSAIDGLEHEFSDSDKSLFHENIHNSKFSKKLMGNQLSHLSIMKMMIERNYGCILVSQDDAVFREGFYTFLTESLMCNLPDDSEFVFVGFHKTACMSMSIPMDLNNCQRDEIRMNKKDINDHVCVLQDTVNPCSLAYLITREGAMRYINHFETVGFNSETDHCMNDYLKKRGLFHASSKICITGNPRLGSDIFGN